MRFNQKKKCSCVISTIIDMYNFSLWKVSSISVQLSQCLAKETADLLSVITA